MLRNPLAYRRRQVARRFEPQLAARKRARISSLVVMIAASGIVRSSSHGDSCQYSGRSQGRRCAKRGLGRDVTEVWAAEFASEYSRADEHAAEHA